MLAKFLFLYQNHFAWNKFDDPKAKTIDKKGHIVLNPAFIKSDRTAIQVNLKFWFPLKVLKEERYKTRVSFQVRLDVEKLIFWWTSEFL